jgi:hypothetical protein
MPPKTAFALALWHDCLRVGSEENLVNITDGGNCEIDNKYGYSISGVINQK